MAYDDTPIYAGLGDDYAPKNTDNNPWPMTVSGVSGIVDGATPGIGRVDAPGVWNRPGAKTSGFPAYRFPDIEQHVVPGQSDLEGNPTDFGAAWSNPKGAFDPNIAPMTDDQKRINANRQAPADFKDPTTNLDYMIPGEAAAPPGEPTDINPPNPGRRGDDGPGRQGASPWDNSILGRALSGFNDWRDQHRMELMALAGGLAGSQSIGQGLGRGFTAAAAAIPQQNALNNQNATINYLMSPAGGSMEPNLARAISSSPALMQEALGQMTGMTPPKTQTIKDFLGQEHMVAWNPKTKSWDSAQINGSGSGPSGGTMGGVNEEQFQAGTPEQRLAMVAQQYGPEAAEAVKGMYEGRITAPPRQPGLLSLAARVYGEEFNQQTAQARQKAYNYWYGGGDGTKAMRALDQVSQHFGDLPTAVEAQGNWGGMATGLNAPANYLAENYLGSTTQGPVRTVANAVTHELSGFWKPGHGSDADINKWAQDFPVNGSLPQQKRQISTLVDLIEGGASANEDIRQSQMGGAASRMAPVMNEATRARLDALKEWANDPNAKWADVAAKHGVQTRGPVAQGGPQQAAPRPVPTGGTNVAANPIDQARAAIAAGAPRDQVIQRLRQMGINPVGL